MSAYLDEPRTAAEAMERWRAAAERRRAQFPVAKPALLPPPPAPKAAKSLTDADRRAVLKQQRPEDAIRKALLREEAQRNTRLQAEMNYAPSRARAIIEQVAKETGIPYAMIVGCSRNAVIVEARFEAIARVATNTGWSLPRIGRVFNRDHTSILNALKKKGVLRTAKQPVNQETQHA